MPKFWRLLAFCLLSMLTALSLALAEPLENAPEKDFWVWNFHGSTHSFRLARGKLRGSGERSAIYVEDSALPQISDESIAHLLEWLEREAPKGAIFPGKGLIEIEEKIFSALPRRIDHDKRLVIFFAHLGEQGKRVDGYFNVFDQMTSARAWEKYRQRSNQGNFIYLNSTQRNDFATLGVVARELQRLLASSATPAKRENWLSETLAYSAKLLTGACEEQDSINRFAQNSGTQQLVSPGAVSLGPQVLFASYLLDELPLESPTAMGFLTKIALGGRDAVELLFRQHSDTPLSFDAIFSNFVTYAFSRAEQAARLPGSWNHAAGFVMPKIDPYFTFKAGSGTFTGFLAPYSFVGIDLAQELSPDAVIKIAKMGESQPPSNSCAQNASVLWKPIDPTRIAVYAVGCNPNGLSEFVQFRLTILDQPSLLPASPLRILP